MTQADLRRAVAEVAAMSSEHQGVWTLLQRFGFDPEEARQDIEAIVRDVFPQWADNDAVLRDVASAFAVGHLVGAQVREEADGSPA